MPDATVGMAVHIVRNGWELRIRKYALVYAVVGSVTKSK
jgi:hypothetical protein